MSSCSCLPPLTLLTWGIRCASQAPWSVWSLSTSIEVTWTAWIKTPIGFWWFGSQNHGFDAKKTGCLSGKVVQMTLAFAKKNMFFDVGSWSKYVPRNGDCVLALHQRFIVRWVPPRLGDWSKLHMTNAVSTHIPAGWISLLSEQRSSQVVGKPSKVTIHGCMYKWQVGSITT